MVFWALAVLLLCTFLQNLPRFFQRGRFFKFYDFFEGNCFSILFWNFLRYYWSPWLRISFRKKSLRLRSFFLAKSLKEKMLIGITFWGIWHCRSLAVIIFSLFFGVRKFGSFRKSFDRSRLKLRVFISFFSIFYDVQSLRFFLYVRCYIIPFKTFFLLFFSEFFRHSRFFFSIF